MKRKLIHGSLMLAVHVCITSIPAHATTLYWDTNGTDAGSGNGSGTWDTGTTANWNPVDDGTGTTQTFADGDSAVFSAGTDGVNFTATVSGTVKPSSLVVEESNNTVTIADGTIDFGTSLGSIDTSGVNSATNHNVVISSTITGTGGLTIAAHGSLADSGGSSNSELKLTGTNTFTDGLTITSGLIGWDLGNDSAFGDASNAITMNGGGVVDDNVAHTFTRDIIVGTGGGTYRVYGSVNSTFAGDLTGSGTFKHTDAGGLIVTGDGSGFSGTILKVGNGANNRGLRIQSNSWDSTSFESISGTINFEGGGTINVGSVLLDSGLRVDGTTLNIKDGAIDYSGGGGWIQVNTGPAGTITSDTGTLAFNWNNTITGLMEMQVMLGDYDGSTPLAVEFNGTGSATINDSQINVNQTNTYSGGTSIDGARVAASNLQTFGTGTVTITDVSGSGGQAYLTAGGTYENDFDISGIGWLESAGNLGAIRFTNNTISGDITVSGNSRVVGYTNQTGTMTGALSGSGDLEINFEANTNANGTINITGDASAFTGDLIVSRGRLNMSSASSGGGVVVAPNGTFVGDTSFGGDLVIQSDLVNMVGGSFTGDGSFAESLVVTDLGTYRGEGSFGGSVTLGETDGTTLVADGTTPAVLHADGNLTLNGVTAVTLTKAVAGANLIATYGGTLTGNETNLDLIGGLAGYRAGAGFDTTSTPGSVILNIPSTTLTWTGNDNDFWETGSSDLNWQDSVPNAQTFFNGDAVIFDATGAAYPNIVITGEVAPISILVDSGLDYGFSGSSTDFIGGYASLLKRGTSTLTISGANTFSGGTTLSQGSIVFTGSQNNGLGTGTIVIGDASTGSGDLSLDLINSRQINNPIEVSSLGTGSVTLSGTGGFTAFNGSLDLGRGVSIVANSTDRMHVGGAITGTGDITVSGGRRLTIGGNCSFDGDIIVTGAGTTLQNFGGNRIPDSSRVEIQAGAAWQLYGNETIAGLDGAGILRPVAGNYTATVGSGDASGTFSGTWTNNGANYLNLVKTGAGTQTFSGTATGTGSLTVNDGVFSLTHPDALHNDGRVNLNGGVLNLDFSGAEQVASLYLDGVEQVVDPGTTYGATGSGADVIDDVHFSGTGTLQVGENPDPYLAYETANNIEGAGAAADSDGDGIANGVEFVIGGVSDPSIGQDDSDKLPTLTDNGSSVTFSFRLSDAAASISPAVWSVEFDADLAGVWTTAVDPGNATITDPGDDANDFRIVTVEIPKSGLPELFARLVVVIP